MLKKFCWSLILICSSASGLSENLCADRNLPTLDHESRSICDHGAEWIKRFKSRDLDSLMKLYVPDAVVALHGQKMLEGRDNVKNYFAKSMAAVKSVEFELEVERIEIHGKVAHLLSKYWFTSTTPDGTLIQDAGRSLLIYKKDLAEQGPGRWKIAFDIDQNSPDIRFPAPSTR
jgi:ketosteroid isomerase-like protein